MRKSPIKIKNTEDFIDESKSKFGDRFDYSKVVYIKYTQHVIIICLNHGEVIQTPRGHLRSNHGCSKCSFDYNAKNRIIKAQNKFIDCAHAIHGDVYSYEKTIYSGSDKKIIVTCKEHGDFNTTPSRMLRGHRCNDCYWEQHPNHKRRTAEEFFDEVNVIYNNHYDYSKSNYVNMAAPIIIICPKHGEFKTIPKDHLNGRICKLCRVHNYNTEIYIIKAKKKHGELYDYEKVNYIGSKNKVIIKCRVHGEFSQNANSHLRGAGCPHCAFSYNTNRLYLDGPAILYYLKVTDVDNTVYYKIGITTLSVEERYSKKELHHIEVLWTKAYEDGYKCYEVEQFILNKFHGYRLREPIEVLKAGYSELFTENVLRDVVVN